MVARNLKQEAAEAAREDLGAVYIVRPSKLADSLKDGFITELLPKDATDDQKAKARKFAIVNNVVAEGTYEKASPNRYNAQKKDFYIRAENGELFIINGTHTLEQQMKLIEGEELKIKLQVVYEGKVPTKSGKERHEFTVKVK